VSARIKESGREYVCVYACIEVIDTNTRLETSVRLGARETGRERGKERGQERESMCVCVCACVRRGGGLGSRPKKMYSERLGDGVEYHLMKPTPRH